MYYAMFYNQKQDSQHLQYAELQKFLYLNSQIIGKENATLNLTFQF